MVWLKRAGIVLLALAAAALPTYWWLLVESHRASPASYVIDIAEVRRLADAVAGEKPRVIRVETVAHLAAPRVFVVAGDDWRQTDLPVSAYELIYPDRTVVVDTALDARIARDMDATAFDRAAYARLSDALAHAALIVVTHEHPDHVGGLLAQPDPKRLLAVARLTREQVRVLDANLATGSFALLHLSPGLFDGYSPIDYDRYRAIAPGVVLIKAPGHTPGSQMVYVRRADGTEFLFVGDVAWQMGNIAAVREKARLVTWMAEEDRGRVRDELAGLAQLRAADPEIHMIPGHDGPVIDALVKAGLLARGF